MFISSKPAEIQPVRAPHATLAVMQGFLIVVTGKLAPGHLEKFLELYKPVVSDQNIGFRFYVLQCSVQGVDVQVVLPQADPGMPRRVAGPVTTLNMAMLSNCAMQAAHVAQHEHGCSAYELSVSIDDPDSFVIYERWVHLGL
jgi:hypothetical protein